MTLPIMYWRDVPRNCALMKSPTAGMNVSSEPANMPGRASGTVTLRNAVQRERDHKAEHGRRRGVAERARELIAVARQRVGVRAPRPRERVALLERPRL